MFLFGLSLYTKKEWLSHLNIWANIGSANRLSSGPMNVSTYTANQLSMNLLQVSYVQLVHQLSVSVVSHLNHSVLIIRLRVRLVIFEFVHELINLVKNFLRFKNRFCVVELSCFCIDELNKGNIVILKDCHFPIR